MDLSDRNRIHLEMLRDIFEVSQGCSTRTYMWGGIVVDILRGKFTREHHDLDGFTLNLLDVLEGIQSGYESRGYAVQYDTKYQILKIEKGGEHASFNRLEVEGEMAMWRHVGDYGTIYFPEVWLDETPRRFYGELTLTSGVKFEYAIKKNVKVFSPEWVLREKHLAAMEYFAAVLKGQGIDPEDVLAQMWGHTPYWSKRGYPQYALPSTDWKSEPL